MQGIYLTILFCICSKYIQQLNSKYYEKIYG